MHLGMTPEGYALNSYFVNHPEMIMGELSTQSTQYGKEECTVVPTEGVELAEQLKEAITHIHGKYEEVEFIEPDFTGIAETIPADPNVKNFSYTVVDGEVYFRENSVMRLCDLNETAKGRIKGMVQLRQIVNELIDYQLEDCLEVLEPFIDEVIPEEEEEFDLSAMDYMDSVALELAI